VNVQEALSYKFEDRQVTYNRRDAILYAIGVGSSDLRYVYENDEHFGVLPTFPVVWGQKGTSFDIVPFGTNMALPGIICDPNMILHGEQGVEIFNKIPVEATLTGKTKILGVYDKGSGALVVQETAFFEGSKLIARTQSSIFIRGIGGFGGDKGPSENFKPPARAPDAEEKEKTGDNQAQIYRLSADYNPLHIDPEIAQMVGFPRPILHGLASYGFSVRAVMRRFCNNDASKVKAVKARFSAPVLPGDTLITQMWKEGSRVFFNVKSVEQGKVVINNAYVDIVGDSPSPSSPSPSPSASASASASAAAGPEVKSSIVFAGMAQVLEKHPEVGKKINAVYQFNLTGAKPTSYVLDLKQGKIYEGTFSGKPDITLTVSDDDYFDMATGVIDPQTAFLKGKVKITGNIMLAQKLNMIQQAAAKL